MIGNRENTYRMTYVLWSLLLIFTSSLVLTSCSQKLESTPHEEAEHDGNEEKDAPGTKFLGTEIIPIKAEGDGDFYKAAGWLSDTEILYIRNKGERSLLYAYNLASGTSKLLFRSDLPIITAEASPNKDKVLVHNAANDKGILTIIDLSGEELYSSSIESYEITFEWNPFNDEILVISAFTEDWDFSTYLLDLRKANLEELDLPEPFVRWISEDELVYQGWEEDGVELQAPLYSTSLQELKSTKLVDNVYQFDTIGKYLLAVKVNEDEAPEIGLYQFLQEGTEPVASFTAPMLTSYSGWVVPFYDLMDKGNNFIYLRAVQEGEADLYQDGFDLIRFNLESEKEEMVFSGLANEPISCSPSGMMCLYGFQLDKVMNMKTKEIIELAE
ncbi:hypothetical protein [Mesobacillus subterraneus]|uniref:YqgU-like 6-bladed beta-propeller domain-containing protein n=1 Tax=Mesobacillus subterraneus TaxID=285983 RepID=A0A3R9FIX6_9BACI|nr:hypothetical protein [Mesobacillus subterraneus]RSD27435.1 hypothetical protein EJA10_10175 [Mesobacillus subterraneus]